MYKLAIINSTTGACIADPVFSRCILAEQNRDLILYNIDGNNAFTEFTDAQDRTFTIPKGHYVCIIIPIEQNNAPTGDNPLIQQAQYSDRHKVQ